MALAKQFAVADVSGPMQGGNIFDAINSNYTPAETRAVPAGGGDEAAALGGNPIVALLTAIGVLVGLAFLRRSSSFLQSNSLAVNAFNFAFIALTSIISIAVAKVVLFRFPVPGLTQLAAIV